MTLLFGRPESGRRRTWIWAIPPLVIVMTLGGQVLALLPAKYLGLITRENVESYPQILFLIIGAFATAGLVFVAWIRLFEVRSLASAGLDIERWRPAWYARGFLLGLVMAAAVVYGVRLLGGYSVESDAGPVSADLGPILVLLLAFGLQAGVEEFVFRGWVLGRFAERYNVTTGVIVSSLLFTLMHVDGEISSSADWAGIAIFASMTMLFSVLLCLIAISERSIWGAAAWHASWNWVFITWFGLPTTGIDLGLAPLVADYMPTAGSPDWLTGAADGPEGSVVAIVVLIVGCTAFLVAGRNPNRKARQSV